MRTARPSSRTLWRYACCAAALWLWSAGAQAQRLLAGPYLQDTTPTRVWISWETSRPDHSVVEWGTTRALGRRSEGVSHASKGVRRIHEVELAGLSPGTRYFYRIRVGTAPSPTYWLRTAPTGSGDARIRILVMSDMQYDRDYPDMFRRVVHDGVLRFVRSEYEPDLADALDLVLLPGDLVAHGQRYRGYRRHFFEPLAPLLHHVPLYPTLGNHEEDSRYYYRYFRLPATGGELKEHSWWRDVANVRLIGIDSNTEFRTVRQLDWLAGVLEAACDNEQIDFVFVALHHPDRSELWPRGGAPYAGLVARRLEAFATRCGKPTLQLFGHTHNYTRGHSRDHRHTLLGVASAGGKLDHVGRTSVDLPEYVMSQDEYGFVVIEVQAGVDPSFRVRRISLGSEREPRENEERDQLTVRRYDRAPATPQALWPRGSQVAPECSHVVTSAFSDPDADAYAALQFQLSESDCNFTRKVREGWFQASATARESDAFGKKALKQPALGALRPDSVYCYRVRVRDAGLVWSNWSEPVRFSTASTAGGRCEPQSLQSSR